MKKQTTAIAIASVFVVTSLFSTGAFAAEVGRGEELQFGPNSSNKIDLAAEVGRGEELQFGPNNSNQNDA